MHQLSNFNFMVLQVFECLSEHLYVNEDIIFTLSICFLVMFRESN